VIDDANPLWEVALETFNSDSQVWALFEEYSLAAAQRHKQYSARTIFERIRWHVEVETNDLEFKLNNNWPPYFSRIFMWRHPHLGPSCWRGDQPEQQPWGQRKPLVNDGFFELRSIDTNFVVEQALFTWAREADEE
jgi:hypothetical protein